MFYHKFTRTKLLFDKLDCWRNTILRSHFYCSTGCEEETLNHQSFQSQPIQYKLAEKFIPQLGFHIAGQGLHPQAAGMNTFTYINYNKKKMTENFEIWMLNKITLNREAKHYLQKRHVLYNIKLVFVFLNAA
jgi:hypothetical protein